MPGRDDRGRALGRGRLVVLGPTVSQNGCVDTVVESSSSLAR
ncbi:hypothetical protein OG413_43435 [Streptomyces sp. NBC_01433]|nr:hypothetical protein [Streptomyces sp. NBC_01433]MCX4682040.1 hypothetical protein [Streptomyces sp. NBC_01433]